MNTTTKISIVLFITFLVFYTLQIPENTSKPDVIVFAIRSLSEMPITEFAYLPQSTMIDKPALPNYHLGHTLILWLAYHLFPISNFPIIWLSGFVSSISGALIVFFTFLIWKELKFNTKTSLLTAIIVGLVPSFWEHAIIGEVYALQYAFVLAFVLSFLKNKIFLSAFFFMYANLISPVSALAFGMIFLKGFNKKNLNSAIFIGIISVILYSIINITLGIDLLKLLNGFDHAPGNRGILYRISALFGFIFLNFNFFIIYLFKCINQSINSVRTTITSLLIVTIPQFLLVFVGATFFIELGSFQLPIFWALAFPLGYYISINTKLNKYLLYGSLIISMFFSYTFWIYTNNEVGKQKEEAGKWLRKNGLTNISVIGPWSVGVHIIQGRDGSNLDALQNYYIEKNCPNDYDIKRTNKDELIIASAKKLPFRVSLSKMKINGLEIEYYDPNESISSGTLNKLFENDSVLLYKWEY